MLRQASLGAGDERKPRAHCPVSRRGLPRALPPALRALLTQVDAEQYYSELEEQLTDEFNAELSRIPMKRLDLIFVTFQDTKMTTR